METLASLDSPTVAPRVPSSWATGNQRYLDAALEDVARHLRRRLSGDPGEEAPAPRTDPREIAREMEAPPALESVVRRFGLSTFEAAVLVLAAGVELDSSFAQLAFRLASQMGPGPHPTFGMALAALPEAHWSALAPGAPLRRWRMLHLDDREGLTRGAIRIDERVLHHLVGVEGIDENLEGFVEPVVGVDAVVPSHRALAERIVAAWTGAGIEGPTAVQLVGDDPSGARAVASEACRQVGLALWSMPAAAVPTAVREFDLLCTLWSREAILGRSALLLEAAELDGNDRARAEVVHRFVEGVEAPLLLAVRDPWTVSRRPAFAVDVPRPSRTEQAAVWKAALGPENRGREPEIDRITDQFDLSVPAIRSAALHLSRGTGTAPDDPAARVWEACRRQARQALEGRAVCVDPRAEWDDLVLPRPQMELLRAIEAQVRHRRQVHEEWGFASRFSRGLGITALFSGASGTGKTLAAEVLARSLRLDLYHVDLSAVVSKYIGETEKNLRRVFDAAEQGGAVLLFDEADALFGKRSEVKDSHDRYANLEVSYLLQRMESYRGLAILTTNLASSLDDAFERRLRFRVAFPFPDAGQREAIWRRVFPEETPTSGLDPKRLASLSATGGTIRNVALHAAFLAADAGSPVSMAHVEAAARSVLAQQGRALTAGETRGWT